MSSPEKCAYTAITDGKNKNSFPPQKHDLFSADPSGRPPSSQYGPSHTIIRSGGRCRVKPQVLAVAVLLALVLLIISGLVVGLTGRTRTRKEPRPVQYKPLIIPPRHPGLSDIPDPKNNPNEYRLPQDVAPVHYDLFLWPQLDGEDSSFYGNVCISLTVLKATHDLVLHSLLNRVWNYSLTKIGDAGEAVPIFDISKRSRDFIWIELGGNGLLPSEEYMLCCEFSDRLTKIYIGIYYDHYMNRQGETK